jgi:hypothetical protein
LYIFTALYLLVGNRNYLGSGSESDPALITDLDPNLKIISDPSGSGCTTLITADPDLVVEIADPDPSKSVDPIGFRISSSALRKRVKIR